MLLLWATFKAGKFDMTEQEELLDIVTREGSITGSLPRSEIHGNPSLIHRVVHVLVSNKQGELFLQKRSTSKDVAPGKWDTSVGGHVNSGESLDEALHREIKEELGIEACKPEFLYKYIHANAYESELVFTYFCLHNGDIVFNRDEIDEVHAWGLDEIRQNLGKGVFSDNFEHEFRLYLKHKDSSEKA
jgi:isopentenyldiphosphate isomerase